MDELNIDPGKSYSYEDLDGKILKLDVYRDRNNNIVVIGRELDTDESYVLNIVLREEQ